MLFVIPFASVFISVRLIHHSDDNAIYSFIALVFCIVGMNFVFSKALEILRIVFLF